MKGILTVLGYTFYEHLRKKTFIVSTVITLILTIAVLNVPAIITHFENSKKTGEDQAVQGKANSTVYVIDSKGLFKDDLQKLEQTFTGYSFKAQPADKLESLKEQVKTGESISLVVIDESGGVPYFTYMVKQYGSGLTPEELSRSLKSIFTERILKSSNVPDNVINMVLSDVSYDIKELGKGMMKGYISCIIIMMLLFFSVYFYGYWVSMSVASEKTSRVMELLLTSTKPSRIIIGKSMAMGLLGLCQLSLIVGSAALTYKISFPKDFAIAGQSLDFSNFTPFIVFMVIVYFILGYSLYAMLNAVAGATVSKAEDVNSAIIPISMITLIAFYFAYAVIALPSGKVAITASIIPLSAPFSMPSRLLMSDVPVWQIAASLLSMTVTIVFAAWISIKLYSSAVLHYGKRLKIAELLKMSKQK